MTKHYAPTETIRASVGEDARIVFKASGAPGTYCQVQVLVPADRDVFMWLDQEPASIGPDRVYKGAPVNVSYNRIDLLPGQSLVLATDSGFAVCALIVHHLHES